LILPTIAFVSSKGGVGKTTSALLLGLGLADAGDPVALVDSDPNLPLSDWSARKPAPAAITVVQAPHFADLPAALRSAKRQAAWTIVDTEGGAPRMGGLAIANADYVITPLSASALEIKEARKMADLVAQVSAKERRAIPFACLFSRTPGGVRRSFSSARGELKALGMPTLSTVLSDKEAFRAIFAYGGGLHELDSRKVSGLASARALAAALTAEVKSLF
jgi:chromosome partitioning protein